MQPMFGTQGGIYFRFYFMMSCSFCGAQVHSDAQETAYGYNGRPAVPVSLFEDTTITCTSCGTVHHVGEINVVSDTPSEDDET